MGPTADAALCLASALALTGVLRTHGSWNRILRHLGEVGRALGRRVAPERGKPYSVDRVPCVCIHTR